jgi:hypothetical protein
MDSTHQIQKDVCALARWTLNLACQLEHTDASLRVNCIDAVTQSENLQCPHAVLKNIHSILGELCGLPFVGATTINGFTNRPTTGGPEIVRLLRKLQVLQAVVKPLNGTKFENDVLKLAQDFCALCQEVDAVIPEYRDIVKRAEDAICTAARPFVKPLEALAALKGILGDLQNLPVNVRMTVDVKDLEWQPTMVGVTAYKTLNFQLCKLAERLAALQEEKVENLAEKLEAVELAQ